MTSILHPAIRMMDTTLNRPSFLQCHPESSQCELGIDLLRERPANHPSGKQIQNHGQIQKARENSNIGDIGYPDLISLPYLEPLEQIRIDPITVITVSGLYPPPLDLTL